jgi:hypothetical protein
MLTVARTMLCRPLSWFNRPSGECGETGRKVRGAEWSGKELYVIRKSRLQMGMTVEAGANWKAGGKGEWTEGG